MNKFKIGDKVRIIDVMEESFAFLIGDISTIVNIDYGFDVPYELDNGYAFASDELELIVENQYIDIKFQEGAIVENGVNGCQIEDVIDVLVERLRGFNFQCRENSLAITKLEEARLWLNERTRKRKELGIEGKNINHE